MNIVLLSAEYPPQPGGIGDYTCRLGAALGQHGHSVTVITSHGSSACTPGKHAPACDELPIQRWNWRCWPVIIAALDRIRPDVLHIQYQTGAYGMHPAINLLPWRLSQLPGRPRVVVTAHDLLEPYLFPKAGPLRRWVTQRLLADSDAVVVTNAEDLAQLNHAAPPTDQRSGAGTRTRSHHIHSLTRIPIGSNISVAPPPGYLREEWRASLGIASSEILVAYFGLISRSKGLDALLDALAHLPPTTRLLVIGGAATSPQDRDYADAIQGQIAAQSLRDRVTITGHCGEHEVSAHLLAADLVALPFADGASFRRGSLLAALAHGLPVVTTTPPHATQHDGPPALRDEEHALLVPPGDVPTLARTIARLAGDAALRAQLGTAGTQLAAHFSWESIATQHEALYVQVTSDE